MKYLLHTERDYRKNKEQIELLANYIFSCAPKKVAVVCGKNDRGINGISLLQKLKKNSKIELALIIDDSNLKSNDFKVVSETKEALRVLHCADIIIDAIGTTKAPYDEWIKLINGTRAEVISIDCPTGIDPVDGSCEKVCVRATKTVVYDIAYSGLYLYPGNVCCGKIIYLSNNHSLKTKMRILEKRDIGKLLPERYKHSHKGTYGKVLLIAGSKGKAGAAILCAKAILKSGAGMLTVLSYPEVCRAINDNLYEAMTIDLNVHSIIQQAQNLDLSNFDLIVFGPGMGRNSITEKLLVYVLSTNKPVVIDADGLYFLNKHMNLLKRKALTVLTPHLGEYQRFMDYEPTTICPDLYSFSKKYPTTVMVLKGENTLMAFDGMITVNITGNNALAKAGSGDVLCGTIGGLLAQKPKVSSVYCGVYVHGYAADKWVSEKGHYSLLASELIEEIGLSISELKGDI